MLKLTSCGKTSNPGLSRMQKEIATSLVCQGSSQKNAEIWHV